MKTAQFYTSGAVSFCRSYVSWILLRPVSGSPVFTSIACGNCRHGEDADRLRGAVQLYFGRRGRIWSRLLWVRQFLGRENFFDGGKKRA